MTDTIASQNIDLSSWITLYTHGSYPQGIEAKVILPIIWDRICTELHNTFPKIIGLSWTMFYFSRPSLYSNWNHKSLTFVKSRG
jgi:hypothetical protein